MYLTQSLHRAVQHTPDAVATICGERMRTHRESVDRIARLAGALVALDVAEGDRVGLLALNSDRFHETVCAVWWRGGAINPVNTRWSAREMVYSLRDPTPASCSSTTPSPPWCPNCSACGTGSGWSCTAPTARHRGRPGRGSQAFASWVPSEMTMLPFRSPPARARADHAGSEA